MAKKAKRAVTAQQIDNACRRGWFVFIGNRQKVLGAATQHRGHAADKGNVWVHLAKSLEWQQVPVSRVVIDPDPSAEKAAKHRQAQLPVVMTGPQVQELLGRKRKRPVTHVTVINLVKAGKLKRIGKAKQRGGGYLYNRQDVEEFARQYTPQDNPVLETAAQLVTSKGGRVHAGAKNRTAKKRKRGLVQGRVDEDALGWLTSVPSDDVNFKSRLKFANLATVKAALATRAVKNTVTKRKVLESRLRKLLSLQ